MITKLDLDAARACAQNGCPHGKVIASLCDEVERLRHQIMSAYASESKECRGCGNLLYRPPAWSAQEWASRKYCSKKCSRTQSVTPSDVLWAKVDKSLGLGPGGNCWHWTGWTDEKGYGRIRLRDRSTSPHRLAYELAAGSRPPRGMHVCHSCDNPRCVRPEHLFLGTHADNVADKMRKGRQPNGAKMHTAKLTDVLVLEIRASGEGARALAKRYGVSVGNIQAILGGRTWRHLLPQNSDARLQHGGC